VPLEPGESTDVTWTVHADRLAWVGVDRRWTVAPHRAALSVGASSTDLRLTGHLAVFGPERRLGPDRVLVTGVRIG